MRGNPRGRRLRGAVLLLVPLTLIPTAACGDSDKPEPKPVPDEQSQSEKSIFEERVIVGVKKGQPGFNTRGQYEYAGFETDLLNDLARKVPFKYEALDIPSLRREEILENGGRDMVVATYSITDTRKKRVDFTAPYFKTRQGLLVKKDDNSIKTLEDLKDKHVCSAKRSTSDPESAEDERGRESIKKALRTDVEPVFLDDYKMCVKELISGGSIDAVWTDKIVLEGFAHQKPYSEDVKVVPGLNIGSEEYYGIGLPEGHEDDCRKLNRALKDFREDGWSAAFSNRFRKVAEVSGSEQTYKPSASEFADLEKDSCGANDK
jgi:glutamate transport system substrate-binding protein